MTTLIENQPHKCIHAVQNTCIVTVCDEQCVKCKKLENEKDNT